MTRMNEHYKEKVVPQLMKDFGYKSVMQVPKLQKIVLNSGVGEATANTGVMKFVEYAMTQIAGQKPVITKAKKAISTYKLREGQPIGCMVTLRKQKMYEFLDRLINVALPRVRDFRGISPKGFDEMGNYTMGIKEQIVFPEIDIEKLDKIRGLNITFVTTAKTAEEGRALLTQMGMPFRK